MLENNRRRFTRVVTDNFARLVVGEIQHDVTLKDVSFKGVLVELEKYHPFKAEDPLQFFWVLSADFPAILIKAQLRWQNHNKVGLEFTAMPPSMAEQLHRFLELNLGSRKLFNRELKQLLDQNKLDS